MYRTRTRYTSVPPLDYYNVIEFNHRYNPYNYTYYHIPEEEPIEVSTTLKKINDTTKLELNSEECFCAVCQDKIKKWDIVRKLGCEHKFHQKCCDKWLETKAMCPMCRQKL